MDNLTQDEADILVTVFSSLGFDVTIQVDDDGGVTSYGNDSRSQLALSAWLGLPWNEIVDHLGNQDDDYPGFADAQDELTELREAVGK